MPPKQSAPSTFPSYEEARRVFTGNRGGKGNLAAAGTVSTAVPRIQSTELASNWIRPQTINQLKRRDIANSHEEEGYIQALLADAEWFHRLGTPRFSRTLKQVLQRDNINNVPIDKVATEPLLAEVIATMADQEARDAGLDPIPRTPATQDEPNLDSDEPILVRIDVPAYTPVEVVARDAGSGGGSGSGGDGNVAAAAIRPPLPRSRSKDKNRVMLRALRVQYDDAEFTTNLITDDISIDLLPGTVREVASNMLERLHDLTFPGDPARHSDDGSHNQFVNDVLRHSPSDYRKSIAYLSTDQSDWMAHHSVLHSLMPMLWLIEEYSPHDAAYAYKGYETTRCLMSKRCIPLIKVFLKSLRYSMCRSSGMAYENFNSPMHYVPWITAEECWVLDVMKFYYDTYGHPSPDFRCFNPTVHYFMRDVEDVAKNRGVFSCCFMGRGMREFIAHQPPTWHQVKFHDAEPLADAGVAGDPTAAIRDAYENDEEKFGESSASNRRRRSICTRACDPRGRPHAGLFF